MTTTKRETKQGWAIDLVASAVQRSPHVYTQTEYGTGQRDWVRVYVIGEDADSGAPTIEEITGPLANAADLPFQNDGKRYGIPYGGGGYSKALEAFESACRIAQVDADQTKWREIGRK